MHRTYLDTSRQPEDGLLRAARFIEASIGRPISLRDVAARSEWSTCHFHRMFRARVGLPVMDYVRRRRLTLAAKRLIESDVPVLEIALDAGFNSQAAFTRAFSRVYRRPPAAYRARGREVPWLSVSPITGGTLALLPGLGTTSPRCVVSPRLRLAGLEITLTARERDSIPTMWRELSAVLRANNLRASVGYGLSTWFSFDRLEFRPDSATLLPSASEQLQNVATIMQAYPAVRVKIGGYTDNSADSAYNLKLSQERAEAAMNRIATLGVDRARLEAEGYGEAHPIADNATPEGRQRNRRVDISVTNK